MRIGVPREIKSNEYRVGLMPEAAREYTAHGHAVLVESGAGAGVGASDAEYAAAGAEIVPDAATVFDRADMIVKVKEPQPQETAHLREGQILFTYLHLAADPKVAKGLMESGCTAVAYETVTDDNYGLPLLAPMSEVAGRLSIHAAAEALTSPRGGRGLLLGGVPGVKPARVVIIGGGVVGLNAARVAVGTEAEVTILDKDLSRLRLLDDLFQGRVRTRYASVHAVEEEVIGADAIIGAVLVAGASAPKLVTAEMRRELKPGTVLVDVAIDQGGCFDGSHPTTHAEPTFKLDGVLFYCVANMPGAVPMTATSALNNATLPFGLALADKGLDALKDDPHLLAGLNVHRGRITHASVAESLNLDYVEPLAALKASA